MANRTITSRVENVVPSRAGLTPVLPAYDGEYYSDWEATQNATVTLYTVPSGKRFMLHTITCGGYQSAASPAQGTVNLFDTGGNNIYRWYYPYGNSIGPLPVFAACYYPAMQLQPGDYIQVWSSINGFRVLCSITGWIVEMVGP